MSENYIFLQLLLLEQLYEIRKTSMSRLICDNAHDIDEIQPLAFVLADERLANYMQYNVNIL